MIGLLPLLVGLVGCKAGPEVHTDALTDTGWFVDTDTDVATACPDRITQTTPVDGQADWYARDALSVGTTSSGGPHYATVLRQADGVEVPVTTAWDGPKWTVTPAAPLAPSTTYAWTITDCEGAHTRSFTTSAFGAPLIDGPASLIRRTYVVDLSRATWVEPKGFGTILALYFTSPLLVGVEWADARMLDLMGAMGGRFSSGDVGQDKSEPTWDLPLASFAESPWFRAEADELRLVVSDAPLRIYGFSLEGTFAADGSAMGGVRLRGAGDTRELGDLVNSPDDPQAICRLAASVGATCTACPDGEVTCLTLDATGIRADAYPGLVLVAITE